MRPLRGIIFDFDGTILDTETPEYETWQQLCAENDVALPIEIWATGVGIGAAENPFDPYRFLADHAAKPVDIAAVRERRARLFVECLAHQEPRPGILSLLTEAHSAGTRVGLASSSGHSWVEPHLARLGLLSFFSARLCADDVAHTKPNPELYTRCLSVLGLEANEAVAIEDSPNGVRAAKAAGMFCIAYPNPLTSLLPGMEIADLHTADLSNLSLAQIIAERTKQKK